MQVELALRVGGGAPDVGRQVRPRCQALQGGPGVHARRHEQPVRQRQGVDLQSLVLTEVDVGAEMSQHNVYGLCGLARCVRRRGRQAPRIEPALIATIVTLSA